MSHHHVIVGDGVTAAEFAISHHCQIGDTITIIGPAVDQLGRGIAYAKAPEHAPWQYAYLLNSPARSVDTQFGEWLGEHWQGVRQAMLGRTPDWLRAAQTYVDAGEFANLNAPREMYGDFYHEKVMAQLHSLRRRGVSIHLLASRVKNIIPNGQAVAQIDGQAGLQTNRNSNSRANSISSDIASGIANKIANNKSNDTARNDRATPGLTVVTEDGQHLLAHSVDVATGGPRNQRIAGDDCEHSFLALFGNEETIAARLQSDARIVCIGAGAAMLDVLRFCQSVTSDTDMQFTAISPTARLLPPLRPGQRFKPTQYQCTGPYASAEQFLQDIKAMQQCALKDGDTFYETRVGLRSLFLKTPLNELIPNNIEARKVARPLFKHFEGGTRDSIDDFNRLMRSGQTRLLSGSVKSIQAEHNQALVHYTDAHRATHTLAASVVVNCAGPGTQHRFDPLTATMLQNNWISICDQSGGIRVGENGQTRLPGVRYLGPAVTSIGQRVEPVPLYDAYRLRMAVQRFNQTDSSPA